MRAIPFLLLPVLILSGHGCNGTPIQPEPVKSAAEVPVKPEVAAMPEAPPRPEASATQKASDFRTWTYTTDRTVKARFAGAGKIHVTLVKEDGKEIIVRLDSLKREDRKLAQRLRDEQKTRKKAAPVAGQPPGEKLLPQVAAAQPAKAEPSEAPPPPPKETAADPIQVQADQAKQAEDADTAAKQAAHRKNLLDTAATSNAETAAKMQPRKWTGKWSVISSNGTLSRKDSVVNPTGKLVRVCLPQGAHYLEMGQVEIRTADGQLLGRQYNQGDDFESTRYIQAFLADWKKKHSKEKETKPAEGPTEKKPAGAPPAADPFQSEVDRQKEAEATAAAKATADHRQKQLENAATQDAETAAKMEPRKWSGYWREILPGGALGNAVTNPTGKLLRVCRTQQYGKWNYTQVEIQTDNGQVLTMETTQMPTHSEPLRYVHVFLADWEKKHSEELRKK